MVVSAPDLRHILGYTEILKLKEDFVVVVVATTGTDSTRKAKASIAVAVVSLR